MIFNDDYISCKECGHREFISQETFLIKQSFADTPRRETIYTKIPSEKILCAKCKSELDIEL